MVFPFARIIKVFLFIPLTYHLSNFFSANNCYHLWTFLEELLDGKLYQNHACVEWTDEQNREFRIINTKQLATLWGQKKGSENMTYDKLSRTFRYYCTYDILKKINGKRLQFKFGAKRMWSKDS